MRLTRTGDSCPNVACPDCGKPQSEQQRNIKKAGKTRQGRQRYGCKTCGRTFTETKGTILYRRRTSQHEIIETLALIAEGVRISSLARIRGCKEDTIRSWIRAAAQHVEAVEEALVTQYRLSRRQLDTLWSHTR